MNLEGKTVLVTGSTRGIGLAIAQAFDKAGARVILHGRSAPKAEVLAKFSEDTMAITADIADDASVKTALDGLFAEIKGIDILVNNAGIVNDKLTMEIGRASCRERVKIEVGG